LKISFVINIIEERITTLGRIKMGLHLQSGGLSFGDFGNEGGNTGETLNDYERGTWTPTRYNGSSGTTSESGGYIHIGEFVFANAKGNTGTGGYAGFASIPFTIGSGGIGSGSCWGSAISTQGAAYYTYAGDGADQFTFENTYLSSQTTAGNNKWVMAFISYYTF
jgi:hypothetical protein